MEEKELIEALDQFIERLEAYSAHMDEEVAAMQDPTQSPEQFQEKLFQALHKDSKEGVFGASQGEIKKMRIKLVELAQKTQKLLGTSQKGDL